MFVLGRGRIAVIAFLLSCATLAHGAVAPQRIMTAIESSKTVTLSGNVHPSARRARDLGAAPADTPLTGLSLRFNMTTTQQNALTQLLSDQQNPASPRYHQWLTPEQFAAQFGLAQADLQKISNWLTSQGFTVTQVARGGTFISFSGTAAQVQSAFHTQLHTLTLDGENHVANLTDPVLPTAIAAVTSSMTGLHDFRPRAHLKLPAAADAINPHYTSAATGNHFVAPGDFYTIYDVNPLLQAGVNGTGVTIAVLGQVNVSFTDIATFRTLAGLSANLPTLSPVPNKPAGNSSNDMLESDLDLEWSGAVAPAATIYFVTGTDVFRDSLTWAVDQNLAHIISASYGECESVAGASMLNSYSTLLQQANAQGQTLVASSGDAGATDCDGTGATASGGLSVDFPAVLPYVTGVGGTMFNDAAGTYWGPNSGNAATALSYIPETTWNEDAAASALDSGGGGVSTFFPKPYWQVGAGVPADSARDVPDVALNAALDHDATLICTTGGTAALNFCVDGYKNSAGSHDIVGGTSVGAPQFAGLLALVEQKTGSRIGNANPIIYALANSGFYSSVFHDVTSGNNSSPCLIGSPNCPSGGPIGYTANVGYDPSSGWGSVDAFALVTDWNLVTPAVATVGNAISTTSLSPSTAAVVQGTPINFTATVTSTNGIAPTGTVQFLVDNVAQGAPVTLNGSTATFSLNTTSVLWGVRTVRAVYSGDASFAGSAASSSITLTSSQPPDFSITPASTSVTTTSGTSASGVVFTLNGLNSFTGTVQFSASATTNASYTFQPNSVTLSNTRTTGTTTLTLIASGARTGATSTASARHQMPPWYEGGSGIALAGILIFVFPRRRRFVGALVAVLSIGLLAATGCGGGGNAGGSSTNATPKGTYTITVTASGTSGSTNVSHTTIVSLVVQ